MLSRFFRIGSTRRLGTLLLMACFALAKTAPADAPSGADGKTAQTTIAQLPPAPEEATPDATPAPPQPTIASAEYSRKPLAVLAQRRNLAFPFTDANIIIYKSLRRLDLRSGGTVIKSYRVALGGNPDGHKTRQGDSRTPEGEYAICTRNSTTSSFHIFLGLTYPTLPDAARGLQSKQINQQEYSTIQRKLAAGQPPLWETDLGGWIGIHGGTDAAFAQKKMRERGSTDWTAGCIAVTNAQIEEIHAATRMGTPVLVLP